MTREGEVQVDSGLVQAAKVLSGSGVYADMFGDIIRLADAGSISDAANALGVTGAYFEASALLLEQLGEIGVDVSEWKKELLEAAAAVNSLGTFEKMVQAAFAVEHPDKDIWDADHAAGYMGIVQSARTLRTILSMGIGGAPSDEEIKLELQL